MNTFQEVIQAVGRGPTKSRHLTFDEGRWAAEQIWSGQVSELQMGGLLVAWRLLGEEPEEVAGLVQGFRQQINAPNLPIDIDWPAYAGKRRFPPYYAYVAWKLSQEGVKILIHGSGEPGSNRYYAEDALMTLEVPTAASLEQAVALFKHHNLVYLPFKHFAQPLTSWLYLKPRLGVRTIFNSICKMLNPLHARVSLQGVFHTPYAHLHAAVGQKLQDPCVVSFKGEGGEAEIRPTATVPYWIATPKKIHEGLWPRKLDASPNPMKNISMEALLHRIESDSLTPYDRAALESTEAFVRQFI
jgi:anthranilate phosphoribosyltransferase